MPPKSKDVTTYFILDAGVDAERAKTDQNNFEYFLYQKSGPEIDFVLGIRYESPNSKRKRRIQNARSTQSARLLQKGQASCFSALRIRAQGGPRQTEGDQHEACAQGVGAGSKGVVFGERAPSARGGYYELGGGEHSVPLSRQESFSMLMV